MTLAVGFFSAGAQEDEIRNLSDSAKTTWYTDFKKTCQIVERAERIIAERGLQGNERYLIDLYNCRILSCNAFSRLQLWRQYTSQLDEFLAKNKNAISREDYSWFGLRNKLAIAQYYLHINDYDKSLEDLLILQMEFKKLPQSVDLCTQLYTILNDIAAIYLQRGEYEASVNQLLASIPYWECAGSDYTMVYRNIGTTYLNKGDYPQARKYLKLAQQFMQENLLQDPVVWSRVALSLYETQATLYDHTGAHDSAVLVMKKALPLLEFRNIDDSFKGRISFSLAKLYEGEGKWKTSHTYVDKAERFFLNSGENQPTSLSSIYLLRAGLFEKENKMNEALASCQKAVEAIALTSKLDEDGNPSLQKLISKKQLFKALEKKSLLLEKHSITTKDRALLMKAFRTNQLTLALLDSTANEFSLDNDKVILARESFSAFESGIRMVYSLYQQTNEAGYLDHCFQLMEKSKGLILLENLRVVNNFAGVPPEWLEKEREIKSELFLTEQLLYQNETSASSLDDMQTAREQYADLKSNYATLMQKIKAEAPDYYKLRFDHHVVGSQQIQNGLLNPHEGLIEFFVGDSALTVFGLSKTKKFVDQKKLTPAFFQEINNFRGLLTEVEGNDRRKELESVSVALFEFLLKDCLAALGSHLSSLIVVPDGVLGYVPLEALKYSKDGNTTYLAETFSIRYAHSVSYLQEQIRKPKKSAKDFFAGFVASGDDRLVASGENPSSTSSRSVGTLAGTKREISAIAELVGNEYTIFDPATKDDFISEASHYNVLHLAMHSVANSQNPMLSSMIFSTSEHDSLKTNQLTALELYNLQLTADMAVLSACETGFGVLHRGEGIMSFARAFSYAGVNSAVISLWKVPDKATALIMINFYTHLKAGKNKAEALRLAKLDFVRDYASMTHPYYWSGFVLTGNNEPLEFPTSLTWLWLTVAMLVIVIALVMFLRHRFNIFSRDRSRWMIGKLR